MVVGKVFWQACRMLIDSHCHLADERFDADRAAVMSRAALAGVDCWVVPSAKSEEWPHLVRLAGRYPGLHPAFGIHPWYCERHRDVHLRELRRLLPGAVALGECGLDFGPERPRQAVQEHWFEQQLQLAEQMHKPVILHAYKALDRLIRLLRAYPGIRGVVHGFAGSSVQAERLVEMGFCLGIGTMLVKSGRLRKLVADIPAEFLLLESDAPDQSLQRGMLNEPAVLPRLLEEMAGIRNLAPEAMAARLNANAVRLFNLESFGVNNDL